MMFIQVSDNLTINAEKISYIAKNGEHTHVFLVADEEGIKVEPAYAASFNSYVFQQTLKNSGGR